MRLNIDCVREVLATVAGAAAAEYTKRMMNREHL